MKVDTKKALFGGALFAAGITGAADAQWTSVGNYQFGFAYAQAGAYSYGFGYGGSGYGAYGAFAYAFHFGPYGGGSSYALGLGSFTPYRVLGYSFGYAFAYGQYSAFTYAFGVGSGNVYVNQPTQVYAYWNWNYAGSGVAFFNGWLIYDIYGGYAVGYAYSNTAPLTGYQTFTLNPGTLYFLGAASTTANGNDFIGASVSAIGIVPTPGTTGALLAAAGLLASRRRR